jgi:hypothetical protein
MPRFIGRTNARFWWNVTLLVILALMVLLVLELTGTTHLFASSCIRRGT